jgi:hypothetical protein
VAFLLDLNIILVKKELFAADTQNIHAEHQGWDRRCEIDPERLPHNERTTGSAAVG